MNRYKKLKPEERIPGWKKHPQSLEVKLDYAVQCNIKNITPEQFYDSTGEDFYLFIKNNQNAFLKASRFDLKIKEINQKLKKILLEGCGCNYEKLCKIHQLLLPPKA